MAQKQLQQQLRDVGSKLESPPASKDALLKLLKQAANYLSELDQSPLPSMMDSMKPCLNAIAKPELLKHQDKDVRLLVATCICEVTRITAPEAPYSDEILKDVFHLIVGTFSGLGDINSPSFGRRVVILETLARYRSCVMMLDLECNDLINEMFKTFLAVISDDHPENILTSMQTIMVLILDESEDVQDNLLITILSALGRKRNDISLAARRLAMKVVEQCAAKLEPSIKQFLVSSLSGDGIYLNTSIDYYEVIYDLYQCAPQILSGIIPYITGELLTDKLDVRLKAVQLLGDLFALPGVPISESFQPLLSEFLKRLTDRVVEVRVSVIEHVKKCLISNPSRPEAPQLIQALSDRLLDYDENVRKQVVAAVCDVACHSSKIISLETSRLMAERLRDKSLSVKKYTMERLADLHKHYCLKGLDGSVATDEFEWIPGKILRCLYDKDFRSETIELILCGSLFPPEFSIKERVRYWVTVLSGFDKVEVKALEQILAQKQRLQLEMQKYLSLRQSNQDGDAPELQKRISGCFRTMSRLFNDAVKAEESFQILNQLKDVNIWKILTSLLDPCTSFRQACTCRDDLLKILGERHPLYDFMGMLSVKCSYVLFNREHVTEILSVAASQTSVGDTKPLLSCMKLLTIMACFSPQLLAGSEEDLVRLLKEDNEIVKEGIANVLAKAGGTIREKLTMTSSSVDLLLERLCSEGTRKQAKYSVQAIAAITKDEGLKSLSVLYKRLVDMLVEKTHLPAVLQSLGCIAQTAMPVFETREDEVVGFITSNILHCSNKADESSSHKTDWSERTELCQLKIYGIKTLVKSYLPVKDAHLRPGIEKLVEMLKNILSFGDISKDIESSDVDKAHMRLASAISFLRLSRQWDHKIPADVFYMTLKIAEERYPESRKLFLNKVHQYIKDRFLDAKYACTFLYDIKEHHSVEYNERKQILCEIIQACHQLKARQLSLQSEVSPPVSYPEFILAYLVHALVHHPVCPNIDECKEVQAFDPIYRRLSLFLALLFNGDEGPKSNGNPNRKESFKAVSSILHSIKGSKDVVDEAKTKTLHAICDLASSITKRLVRDQTDISWTPTSVPLPTILYEPFQSKNSMENDEQTWLCNANTLAHFEALDIDNNERVVSVNAMDELAAEDCDKEGNEVPLKKLMKILKSQGAKKKKTVKKSTTPSDVKTSENEIDVLRMVHEINLDTQERAQSMETGKLIDESENYGDETIARREKNKKTLLLQKLGRKNSTNALAVATPKRKRSNSVQKPFSGSTKGPRQSGKLNSLNSVQLVESMLDSTDQHLPVPLPESKSIFSGITKKNPEKSPLVEASDDFPMKSIIEVEADKKIGNTETSIGSVRKRKRRSIAGIAKCSSHSMEKHEDELVGSRIKVWWPLDKQFYEGLVQSFDSGKKKHVILYDDGDIEVLNLDKEKWQLATNDYVPRKKAKSESPSIYKELSHVKAGTQSDSKQSVNSSKKRKATSKKSVQRSTKVPESKIDVHSDVERTSISISPSVHFNSASDDDDINSDRPETPTSEVGAQNGVDSIEKSGEAVQEKTVSSGLGSEGDSDDEPLSAWRQRPGKSI